MRAVKLDFLEDIDYDSNIEIAEGIYWVGFADKKAGLHCNSYLIVDNDEAVLIDGGSRKDFSTVMLKIMRTGVNPKNIIRLIYQHYDPDLCGNLPHMEALVENEKLAILSHRENNVFIDYYSDKTEKQCIEEQGFCFTFASGRRFEFIHTPYSHSIGSFVTYDTKTKVLFSSDIFGSYDTDWDLYTQIDESCSNCEPDKICPVTGKLCQIVGMWDFHKRIMTSAKALRYALKKIEGLDISLIAPQHGSILHTPVSQRVAMERLKSLSEIGIDNILGKEQAHE
jgi:flavorubredoxin